MITVGLTGGIAMGKSTIARTFVSNGIPVVDADFIARQVVQLGTPGLASVIQLFGEAMLLPDGNLNRAKLGELVFSHPNLEFRKRSMSDLNTTMAPLIAEESASQIKKFQDAGHPIVCYDAPLLCETGNASKYRPLVVAWCPRDMQLDRLMSRNGLTAAQASDRIAAQMPAEQKAHMADQVIYTFGTVEDSIRQTELYIEVLKKML